MSTKTVLPPLLISAALLLAGCERQAPAPPANEAAPRAETNLAEALPLPTPVLDRSGFLSAISAAASAHTAGADDRAAQEALDGRRFAIRLRFGCGGPSEKGGEAPLQWTKVEDGKSFEVRATPDLSLDSEQFEGIASETIEAVEGFWLPRPWLLTDACPAVRDDVQPTPLTPARLVGLAQYFTAEDSRVSRRSGRSYVSVEKVDSAEELPKSGLALLLEGRLRTWPDGKVIRCRGSGVASQPQCIAAAHLDRAAFELPDGTELAEWRTQ